MMLLFRMPEALQDFTEALGVYDNRQILDKEHMYKRFNPQVYIFVSVYYSNCSLYVYIISPMPNSKQGRS
jgi:hypothetical protein